jgi:7-keto-8-aminopelargonate synthetase-like enzyme
VGDDTLLYAACFDANGGVFEPLLGPDTAVITDALNHASIIDAIRLTKAKRYLCQHSDMDDLKATLIEAQDHPILPIMLYNAKLAQDMAAELLGEGIYVIGFSYPVVPKGQARIRVQISAAHTRAHLDKAISSFERVGKRLGVVKKSPY